MALQLPPSELRRVLDADLRLCRDAWRLLGDGSPEAEEARRRVEALGTRVRDGAVLWPHERDDVRSLVTRLGGAVQVVPMIWDPLTPARTTRSKGSRLPAEKRAQRRWKRKKDGRSGRNGRDWA